MNERDVFIAALQKESREQRREYLDAACGDNGALRQQVEALLEAHDRAGNFLQEPAIGHVGKTTSLRGCEVVAELASERPHESDTPPAGETSQRIESVRDESADSRTEAVDSEPPLLGFLAPPLEPDKLGRMGGYRVLRLLGQGGMGMVFLAEDVLLQRQVALKVMRPELAANIQSRQRFLREARAAANVHSDYVVNVHYVDQEGDLPYMVMELLRGQSLAEALEQRHRLPLRESLRIARETAEGLAAAHASGLIHRDVKPGNVWLEEPNGRVKLLDFGLARARTGPLITQRHVILGTPAYMSPEQASGQPLDDRSDLFSLGAMLYHVLTGQPPFAGEDLLVVLSNLANATRSPATELVPGLPASVAELLDRLMARNPADRPASAAEVARTLLELEQEPAVLAPASNSTPLLANSVTTAQPAVPTTRRRRLALLGGLGLTGLAIGLLVAALAGGFDRRTDDGQTRAEDGPPPAATGLPAQVDSPVVVNGPAITELPPAKEFSLIGHRSQIQSLVFTADSKTLVSAEYWEGKILFWDVVRREETFRTLTVPEGFLECLALDPQGRWLAVSPMSKVGQKHPGIRLFRFRERQAVGKLVGHTDRVLQLAFLKDGRTLLSTGYDGSIRCWDVQKQQEGKPLRAGGPRLDSLNVWEDGKGGLRLALGGTGFASLNDVVLERFPYSPGRAVLSPDGTRLACSKQERVVQPNPSDVSLWGVPDQTPLGELLKAPVAEGLAFTPDSKHVIVMGADYTCIYETTTRQPVARITPNEKAVSLAVSPDGRWLAIGTLKGTVRIWHLPSLLLPN